MIDNQIIKFASDTTNYGIKKESDFIASSKNKICGDKITIELEIKKKIIKKMSYETEACIFCQASVSLLSKKTLNKKVDNVKILLMNSENFFDKNKDLINNEWKEFEIILNKKNIARKDCLLLPFKTMQKAF